LTRIEAAALDGLYLRVVVSSTVLFIVSDTALNPFQISFSDQDFRPEFDQWRRLRASGVIVDLRRIRIIGSGFRLAEYQFDFSEFSEESALKQGTMQTKIFKPREASRGEESKGEPRTRLSDQMKPFSGPPMASTKATRVPKLSKPRPRHQVK
jgi:hypothetical protein